MKAQYGRRADQEFWREHWTGSDGQAAVEAASRSPLGYMLRRALPPYTRVLDVGCGAGQWTLLMRMWGHKVLPIDWVSELQVPFEFIIADARRIPIPARTMDAYVSLGIWEHDEHGPAAFAEEAYRVLKPGGRLIVSVPYLHLWERLRPSAPPIGEFYQYQFTQREFVDMLRRHNFKILWTDFYGIAGGSSIPPQVRRRMRWLRRLPGLKWLAGRALFVVAERC